MTELEQLEAITEARYQQQQQGFQKVVAEENRLRSELSRLDQHLRDSQTAIYKDTPMRTIGADVIWQGWVGQRKAELNMKLARVLAMKEHHLKQVRTAYGKLIVAQTLRNDAETALRKDREKAQLNRAIDQTLY